MNPNQSLNVQTTHVGDIPVLSVAPTEAQHCPIVFFIPGFTGRKESGLNLGYQLAQRGVFFVSFDPLLHGERYEDRLLQAATPEQGGIYPPDTGLDTGLLFFRIIQQCLLDVKTLIEHFANDPRADVSRCGVTGFSMGAYAAFLTFANLPQMKAAVPMMGIPNFTRRWLDLLDECSFSNREWAAALTKVEAATRQNTAFIQEIDPHEKLKEASPRALLMMNGDFDTDQPKLYSIYAHRELLPYYAAQPEALQLNIYPTAHTLTSTMEQDAADWFSKWLFK